MKKIGILTSGGDAPGMNSAIRAITLNALHHGIEIYGVLDGYKGLINDQLQLLKREDVKKIIKLGGTILGSARLPEFEQPSVQEKAVNVLKKHDIDSLFVIGGNGTYKGALALSKHGINCIGLPGTIDNDIESTDYAIGYATACQTAVDAIEKIMDTANSHHRFFLIETMGRHCGDIAWRSALASGADLVFTAETGYDEKLLLETVALRKQEKAQSIVVVIAEHLLDINQLAKHLEEVTGLEVRTSVLGHIQRGGCPSVEDRVIASTMGDFAFNESFNHPGSFCVGMKNNRLVRIPIEEALQYPKNNNNDFNEVIKRLR